MARLTTKERKALPKKDFALPSKKTKGNKSGKGGYPIPDASHARNALARVSQFGSPAEKKAVKAKVRAKFPEIGAKERHKSNARKGVHVQSMRKKG